MDSRMGRTDSGHEKRVKEGGEEADDATRELKLSVLTIYFFYSPGFCPLYLFWPTTFLLFPHVCAMGSVLEVSLAGGLRSGVFSSSPLKMRPVMRLSYSIASSLSTETHPLFLPPVPKQNQLFFFIYSPFN